MPERFKHYLIGALIAASGFGVLCLGLGHARAQINNPSQVPTIIYLTTKSDVGLNAAIKALPLTGGTIDLNGCNVILMNTVEIDRPVYIRGNVGNLATGCQIVWDGGAADAFKVDGNNTSGPGNTINPVHGTILDGFTLANGGTGTSGIEVTGSVYYFQARNITIENGTGWSVAPISLGTDASHVLINPSLYNVRLAGSLVNLYVGNANALDIISSSISNPLAAGANIQIGDSTHEATNVNIFGGNVENDNNTSPSIVVENAQGVSMYGVYEEINFSGGVFLTCPSGISRCTGIRDFGSRVAMPASGATNIYSFNFASADVSIDGMSVINPPAGSFVLQNTSLAFANLSHIQSVGAAIGMTSGAVTFNVSIGPGVNNGTITGFQTPTLYASGPVPTATGTGACLTTGTVTGGGWIGRVSCTGTTGASTLTITPNLPNAHDNFYCDAKDLTTTADIATVTTASNAACTFTFPSITANDVIQFEVVGY